ncbi:hypothetical protein J3F83DRAFT_718824 [Trichoderma novae-zelandiae]
MKFSIVLALLPLALAAPQAASNAPRDAAVDAKRPCCSECSTTIYKACREACWDRGAFGYCTFQCVQDRTNCLSNCGPCANDQPKAAESS